MHFSKLNTQPEEKDIMLTRYKRLQKIRKSVNFIKKIQNFKRGNVFHSVISCLILATIMSMRITKKDSFNQKGNSVQVHF